MTFKRFVLLVPYAASLACPGGMVAAEDQSYADLVNSILPTVVSISVKGTGPSSIQSSEGKNVAYAPHIIDVVGAGTITDASGLIVTNKHVIANAPIRARNGITTALPAM